MPATTPALCSFSTRMSELRQAPMPRKTASNPSSRSEAIVKSRPSAWLVCSVAPSPRICAISRSSTCFGSRYSGMPYRSIPPGSGWASKIETPWPRTAR